MIELSTSRLSLCELNDSFLHDIFEYCKLPEVVEMVGMRLHTSIDVTKKYLEHELKKSETRGLVLRDTNKLIGTVSLRKQYNDSELDIRLISCVINPLYWGKGYAPEAIKEIIKFAFETENVHKVLGGHYSFNMQSASVNQKLGFIYEGRQRQVLKYHGKLVDAVEYSLLYEDYKKVSKKW